MVELQLMMTGFTAVSFMGFGRGRHQDGFDQAGDVMSDYLGAGVTGVEIGEDDDGETVVDVA